LYCPWIGVGSRTICADPVFNTSSTVVVIPWVVVIVRTPLRAEHYLHHFIYKLDTKWCLVEQGLFRFLLNTKF
jgi:hypothetical protein